MVNALFSCDEAPTPKAWQAESWDIRESIRHYGPRATLNLRLENLSHALVGTLSTIAADLVRIAAYAYLADQSIRRGGPKDVHGKRWRRHLALSVPVTDPDVWRREPVYTALHDTLNFVSDDHWEFDFTSGAPEGGQLPLNMDKSVLHGNPDSVVLFSGGADSLCAVVDGVTKANGRPVLISHRPAPPLDSRQKRLRTALRQRFTHWGFPHISCWVHRRGSEAVETSQRTRSFLYASLGTAVASALELEEVVLADNGVVSLNIPINAQLVGSLATRSTHPKFLALFNHLAAEIFDQPPKLTNTLWNRTRAEALATLPETGTEDLLQETVSCAHARGRPAVQPNCGVCSQCIDRRFGSIAAGLEEHDLPERYGLDIFRDELPPGNARTLAVSFVRFASQISDTDGTTLFDDFPQLVDCVLTDDPEPSKTADELIALLKRHAASVLRVMETQIATHTAALASGKVSPNSLLALVASGMTPTDESIRANGEHEDFRHSEDFRSVFLRGQEYTLTTQQAQIVEMLYDAHRNKTPDLSPEYILDRIGSPGSRFRDSFRNSDAWGTLVVPGKRRGTYRLNL